LVIGLVTGMVAGAGKARARFVATVVRVERRVLGAVMAK
jgi:hypothetical protein